IICTYCLYYRALHRADRQQRPMGIRDRSPVLHVEQPREADGVFNQAQQNHTLESVLDRKLIQASIPALEKGEAVNADFPIVNTDRSVGTMRSNEISTVYKDQGVPRPKKVKFKGSAGQFSCAFLA
ncbi:hypothetical protein UF37_20640, partial [Vibrio parahaemolyticus]